MIETHWNEFLPKEQTRTGFSFIHGELTPLEMPGTDAYFRAVLGAMRRAAESRCRFKAPKAKKTKAPKVRIVHTPDGAISSQLCDHCGRPIIPGDLAYASVNRPSVAHRSCVRVFTTYENGHVLLSDTPGDRSEAFPVICVGEDRYGEACAVELIGGAA